MNLTQYVLGIVAAVFTLGVVVEMLRRRHLRERHAFWWLIAGLLALLIAVFPSILVWASDTLGFEIPINLVFFACFLVLFLVLLQHSSELTKQEGRSRRLAEEVALVKERLEELEKKNGKPSPKPLRKRTKP